MHILYLHQHFALPSGSTGTRSYEMARRWVAAGHKVTMICGRGDICGLPAENTFEIEGIRVFITGARYSQKQRFITRLWVFFCFMVACTTRGLRAGKVDIVYASSTPLTIGIPAMIIKWIKRIPFVFEVRDQWPEVPIEMGIIKNPLLKMFLLRLECCIYKNAAAIVALSPGMAEGIQKVVGKPEKKILVAPNGADIELFRPDIDGSFIRREMAWQDKFIVMHFGTIGHANGLDFLVNAAARCVNYPDILFVLIGSGCQKERLAKKAEDMKLRNIVLVEKRPKSEMPHWVAACDISTVIFANYPILEHNSANKFFDSLAAGKPVLLNYSGWQRELLERYNAGLGCCLCDIDDYIQKLLLLYGDKERLKEMGLNARKLAVQKFTRDRIASDILALIVEVLTNDQR